MATALRAWVVVVEEVVVVWQAWGLVVVTE